MKAAIAVPLYAIMFGLSHFKKHMVALDILVRRGNFIRVAYRVSPRFKECIDEVKLKLPYLAKLIG
jgi:hypothetical protein